ncbi:DUF4123 domain-containing protein [Paraburkholderia sp. D15]|uniref:DUF4123 domain-containing protein n=1 Tax=Paraburkholderia sp. D15 TaxID=2880218 RepID=UPI00247A7B8B|nr:DUF4123 domain-containing protein [Paraburkholderia sp. D15]WGS49984.1 DUF4123 domain-containing protein [Paraburkholderia sp. D15]
MPVSAVLDETTFRSYPYALINPLQVDDTEWRDLRSEPIVPPRFKDQAELFPRLVELYDMDERGRDDLLARARRWEAECGTPYFCSLLHSQAEPARVREHLARQMVQYHHARRDYDVVRLHDPRVLWHLNWLLGASQWASLLGPVQRWAWPTADGAWQSREQTAAAHSPRDAQEPQEPHDGHARLLLAPKQWDTLLRLGDINETLKHLRRRAPQVPVDAALARRIDASIEIAWTQHRLADASDRQLYAEQAVRFHADIHAHPELLACLARAQAGELSYVGACRHLNEAAMQRLSRELDQSKERI